MVGNNHIFEPRESGAAFETPMIGESPPMIRLRQLIERMARNEAPVLITGETGTGKELVARALHRESNRAEGPLVSINCPAIPTELFQAEVFGYKKGAFTGAEKSHEGRIEAAQGGTLLLDEIGDLPLSIQAVLLRFLEEGTFERLGSVTPIPANVRIVAATHKDLSKAIETNRFRADLFYRLDALHLRTPPLRDRGRDCLLLTTHFIECYCRKHEIPTPRLSREAQEAVLAYHWPGNVREVRNHVMNAMVLYKEGELSRTDLDLPEPGESATASNHRRMTLHDYRMKAECQAIMNALRASEGNVESASHLLDISRAQLYRLIKLHGLHPGPD